MADIPPPPAGYRLKGSPASVPPPPVGYKIKPETDQGVFAKAGKFLSDLATGNDRTEFEELPEFDLPPQMALQKPMATARTALGLMASFDPKRQRKVLEQNFPDLTFIEDSFGNTIVDASAYGGERGYLNKPGMSSRDATQAVFQGAAFTPAGKAAKTGGSLARAAKVGAAAGATQAGIDLASQATGGTDEVSVTSIEPVDLALAAGGGAVLEFLGPKLKSLLPQFRKSPRITDDVRGEFKAAARASGQDPESITDEFISSALRAADKASKPSRDRIAQEAAQQSDEFGIRLSRGQALPDGARKAKQMSLEDTLRTGAGGPRAEAVMQRFERRQAEDVASAGNRVRSSLGGPVIETPNEAAGLVARRVQSGADALDADISQAYDSVGDAYLSVEGMQGLADRLAGVAREQGFTRARDLAPATNEALARISRVRQFLKKSGDKVKPAHLNMMNEQRRRMGALIDSAENQADRRQVTILKQEFDRYLDSAVDNALFSGDTAAIESLKNARKLTRKYFELYTKQDARAKKTGRALRDNAGDLIERIANEDPNVTDEQLVNYLFGVSQIGARKGATALASNLKKIVGRESDEWNAIRQAGFMKLLKPDPEGRISGKMLMKRLEESSKGGGESFFRELYTPAEVAKMKRFAMAVIRTQPDKRNPSGTAGKLTEIARQNLETVATMLGFAKGGAAGGLGAKVAMEGSEGLLNVRQTLAALKATRNPLENISRTPAGIAAASPAAVASSEE